jgi:putative nucleotidyltransferase with HDIG domain
VGDFAVKLGNCIKCRVYKEFRGDEIRQLQDGFNRMSLTLKINEEDLKRRVSEVNGLNRDLERNNVKLTTLLDASKLMTSTLELDQVLTDSMRIILNATDLKAGIILLLEEDLDKRCYEYFSCKAYNCPAYKAAVNCWLLSGTMCHGEPSACPENAAASECWGGRRIHSHLRPARDYDEKMKACSNCEFFSSIVLVPRMTAGFRNGVLLGDKLHLDGSTVHRALVMGQAIVDYSGKNPFDLPIETATEIAMPLKMQEKMIGILYLASDEKLRYDRHHTEFFHLLSEVISSGIFNSRLYDDIERSYLQTVGALANAIEAKDPYTKGHSERVANLSIKMADALGLSGQEKEHLNFAALLHDVGKIGINRDILRKNCALDKGEEDEMKSHPDKGVQILAPIHFLKPVLSSIRHHHEQFDGSGYPLGLKGGEIPFKSRILSVADAWDAMRSDRPYRATLSVEEAKNEMQKHAGTQFDPKVVEALASCLQDAPHS